MAKWDNPQVLFFFFFLQLNIVLTEVGDVVSSRLQNGVTIPRILIKQTWTFHTNTSMHSNSFKDTWLFISSHLHVTFLRIGIFVKQITWHSCNWMDLASLLNSFVPLSILETLCCHLTLLTELGVFCHEQWPWDTFHCMLHSCMWQIFVVSKEVSRVHPIFSFYSPLADCVLIDK